MTTNQVKKIIKKIEDAKATRGYLVTFHLNNGLMVHYNTRSDLRTYREGIFTIHNDSRKMDEYISLEDISHITASEWK